VLGTYVAQQETLQSLLLASAVAAIGILLLLQAAFASWQLAWAVFLTVPLSLAGGILVALLTTGGVLSISVLAALALIFVITIRNSTALVSHCQKLLQEEGEFGMELVLRGARERVAPTMMTLLAMALIFIPFLVFGNVPGHELIFPMVPIVIGGLITSAVLTLLVIPALFLRFGNSPVRAGEMQSTPMSAMPAK
jgi:Cu/Ag efflux pump CusA